MLKKLEEKSAQKKIEYNSLMEELNECMHSRDISLQHLAYANDEYQEALRALEEAKQLMADKLERLRAVSNRVKMTSTQYSSLVKKKAIVSDEIVDLHLKRETLITKQYIDDTEKDEKKQKTHDKKMKKETQPILKKIQKMPNDVMILIRDYLPYNVRVCLIEDKFNSVMKKCTGANTPEMFVAFLNYAATCPEFLYFLSRKEARRQIPSMTPRGYHWRHYTFCLCNKTNKPITQLVKNKITWLSKYAKTNNPEFAYKIMKTIVVFGDINKYKVSSIISPKRYLTIEDLPPSYR